MLARRFPFHPPLLLMLAALAGRAIFLPFSQGAYTDGILAIETFRFGLSYWPPLYALAARALFWLPGVDLQMAGRLVSLLAGALTVLPLMALAGRLFGHRAARWAAIVWIVSPLPMRWSLQVMTDPLMILLWAGALAALASAIDLRPPHHLRPAAPDPRAAFSTLLLASLLGALATLTRYQGIFLLAPMLIAAWWLGRGRPAIWFALLPWLVVPAWLGREGLGPLLAHFEQIGERAHGITLYALLAEEFLMRAPYFFGWGIFAFMIYGLLRADWSNSRTRAAGWTALYLTVAVLALQAVFMSFQERYLLPLAPLVCLFAGQGFAVWQGRIAGRSRWFLIPIAAALGHALVFSALVAFWQGQPFHDLEQATRLVSQIPAQSAPRVWTNEFYNPRVDSQAGPPKVVFWLGDQRPVGFLPPEAWNALAPGDVIIYSNWYFPGSHSDFLQFVASQARARNLRLLARHSRRAVPLLPDLMPPDLGVNQHPNAVAFRYQPILFETFVLQAP